MNLHSDNKEITERSDFMNNISMLRESLSQREWYCDIAVNFQKSAEEVKYT